jgi:hypothetical protein
MTDEEIKKEVEQIKHIKQEILDDYEKLDKSYSRNILVELIFFLIVVVFLLVFLFSL